MLLIIKSFLFGFGSISDMITLSWHYSQFKKSARFLHKEPKDHPDTDLKELVRDGSDEVIGESKFFHRGEEAGVMVFGVREMMQGLKAIGREIQRHK